jgi:hypothetical protein
LHDICRTHRVTTFEEDQGIPWTPEVAAPDGLHSSAALRGARSQRFARLLIDQPA